MLGYTVSILQRNKSADKRHLGVRLGRVCIEQSIPVQDIADRFNVSRPTVYRWFCGERDPKQHLRMDIERYIESLGG